MTFVLAGEPPVRGGNGRTICGPAESPEGDLLPSQRRCMPVGPNDCPEGSACLGPSVPLLSQGGDTRQQEGRHCSFGRS